MGRAEPPSPYLKFTPPSNLPNFVAAIVALTLEEKLAGRKQIKALEAQRSQRGRSPFDTQDQVDKPPEDWVANLEWKRGQPVPAKRHFTIRWRLT